MRYGRLCRSLQQRMRDFASCLSLLEEKMETSPARCKRLLSRFQSWFLSSNKTKVEYLSILLTSKGSLEIPRVKDSLQESFLLAQSCTKKKAVFSVPWIDLLKGLFHITAVNHCAGCERNRANNPLVSYAFPPHWQ